MDSATSLSGDTAVHEHDYGPVVGFAFVAASWTVSTVTTAFAAAPGLLTEPSRIEMLDRFFVVGTHFAMFLTASFGVYKVFSPSLTKTWDWLRRR